MTLELLFPHFDELIRTPEDVQRLNEAILQLAVRGKLVAQDPNDEPASELLKRIELDKERLIARKVIGTSGQDVVLDQTQAQYALPKQWSWAAVADVGYIERGVSFPASAKVAAPMDGHIACLRTTNIQVEVDWEDLIYIPRDYVTGEAKLVHRNDIIISMANSFELVGKVSYVDDPPMEATFGGFIAAFRSVGEMNTRYVFLVMKSPFMQEMLRRSSSQTTNIANISLGRTYPLPFPVPPLAEQQRIVAKVDQLFAQTRALEASLRQAQAEIVTANRAALHRLHTAQDDDQFQAAWRTLRDHFDVLYDDPRNVAELRQAILDLAVRGKLVAQDPEDEPASQLLRQNRSQSEQLRIGDGTRTQAGHDPIVEMAPFLIPAGWVWIRLGEIVESMTNGIYKPASFYDDNGIACLRMYNIQVGAISFHDLKRMELTADELQTYGLRAGDLIVNRVNSRELVGKAAVIPALVEPLVYESKNIRVRFRAGCVQPEFVSILFRTTITRSVFDEIAKQTTGQASINQTQLSDLQIPFPPIAEQHRIVARVDQLMRLCDALEAGLAQGEALRHSLAAAVWHRTTAS